MQFRNNNPLIFITCFTRRRKLSWEIPDVGTGGLCKSNYRSLTTKISLLDFKLLYDSHSVNSFVCAISVPIYSAR